MEMSLAFETARDLIAQQMNHVQMNEQSRAKLMDLNILLEDFITSGSLDWQNNFCLDPKNFSEFLALSQAFVNDRCELVNKMPEKLVTLAITKNELDKLTKEYRHASNVPLDNLNDDSFTVETYSKKAKDHYRCGFELSNFSVYSFLNQQP